MIRYIFFSAIMFLTFVQCNAPKEKVNETEKLPLDFEDFFTQFHSDSLFQIQHIQFPLEGARKASGTNMDLMIPVKWYKDDWTMHKPFNPYNGTFERKFYMIGTVIVEKINDKGGFFSMERRFTKLDDDWTLIYYSVTN